MSERYDALCVREYEGSDGEKRTSWTRIGVAFPARNDDGYTILLDAMPAPVKGQFKILLRPPREKDEQKPATGSRRQADIDDEIPF